MLTSPNAFPTHLYTIADLNTTQINTLLKTAQKYLNENAHLHTQYDLLSQKTLVNAFFEPSTRTLVSFELAAMRLGADIIHWSENISSTQKGETTFDTIATLAAMGCHYFVIRHTDETCFPMLCTNLQSNVTLINAGSGAHAHPSQGLLDLLTIVQHKPKLSDLKITIAGDIKHSRVARSTVQALQKLGAGSINFVAPSALLPEEHDYPGVHFSTDFDKTLEGSDVVMMLRVQRERMTAAHLPNTASYFAEYGLSKQRLQLAKSDAIVMHPGPMNRGIEIADDVADGPQSVILQQVTNGVAIRMAILTHFGT